MIHICPICKKEFDNSQKFGGHFSSHYRPKHYPPRKSLNIKYLKLSDSDIYSNCQYCGLTCKNQNTLIQHQIRCKSNPGRISLTNSSEGFKIYFKNKQQYTKNKKYKCKYCDNSFNNPQILGGHTPLCEHNPNRQNTLIKTITALNNRSLERKQIQYEKQSESVSKLISSGLFNPLSHFKNGSCDYTKCRNRKPLHYRSSLEKIILDYIEINNIFDYYDYESLRIPYIHNNINLKTVVDLICYKNNIAEIIEIKPWQYLKFPDTCYDEKIISKLQAIYQYSKIKSLDCYVLSEYEKRIIKINLISYFENGWNDSLINDF